jgi:manganese/zinc/iron transport system permease protein
VERMNPYTGQTFFDFLIVFMIRLGKFVLGELPLKLLASDEIQILVLVCVAASSALVGSFLVLRKMTMLANSLSHTILLGIVVAYVLTRDGLLGDAHDESGTINIQVMLAAALIMGLVTAFLTEFLTKTIRLQEDASTGLVFTSLFALGVTLVTLLTRNAHIGAEVVMGNVDALHFDDCKLVLVILAVNVLSFLLFFKEFKITTFDPNLSSALGISTLFFNYLLMVQVSATTIGAFRAIGVLMVLAFITGPALVARLLTDDLSKMLLLAVSLGCSASIMGVALSRHLLTVYDLALSTGGIVVCTIVAQFLVILSLNQIKKRIALSVFISCI